MINSRFMEKMVVDLYELLPNATISQRNRYSGSWDLRPLVLPTSSLDS
jgi:hypothetical protein